jgi:hypothetical protein
MNTTVTNQSGKEINFYSAAILMDAEIREALANDGEERTDQEFFEAYEKAHEAKYGEQWELSKANPVW